MPANGARMSDASPSAQVPVRTRALICPRNTVRVYPCAACARRRLRLHAVRVSLCDVRARRRPRLAVASRTANKKLAYHNLLTNLTAVCP